MFTGKYIALVLAHIHRHTQHTILAHTHTHTQTYTLCACTHVCNDWIIGSTLDRWSAEDQSRLVGVYSLPIRSQNHGQLVSWYVLIGFPVWQVWPCSQAG